MEHQHEILHCAGCYKPIAKLSPEQSEEIANLPNPSIWVYRGKEYIHCDGAIFHKECAKRDSLLVKLFNL